MAPAISISNRLLVALPREDLDFLRPHLEPVPLPHKQTLSEPNAPIDHVHFVQEGMVSLVQPLENGAMIEVGMIGNEGFVGVPVLLGAVLRVRGSMTAGLYRWRPKAQHDLWVSGGPASTPAAGIRRVSLESHHP